MEASLLMGLLAGIWLGCLGGCGNAAGESTPEPAGVAPSEPATETAPPVPAEVSPTEAATENWPEFRGPGRQGTSRDTGLPLEWSDTQNMDWKLRLPGPGTSSPITWGNQIYVTCYSGYGESEESPGEMGGLKYHLVCVNRRDGVSAWAREIEPKAGVVGYGGFPALHGYATHTPVADETGVYAFFGTTGLFKYSHDGKLLWEKSCGSRLGTDGWGSGSSPVLYQDLVIMHAEPESETIYAFDRRTGNEVWQQKFPSGDQNTRATPLIVPGTPDQLVIHSRMGRLTWLNPASGAILHEAKGTRDYQNPSPITDGRAVYVLTGGQALAFGADRNKLWEINKGSEICTPLFHDGHLYWSLQEGGVVYCVNAGSGAMVYQARLEPAPKHIYASGVLADGKIYYVSREQGTYVIAAEPKFRQLAHNTLESDPGVFNATPAISRGQLLLRSNRYLYCVGRRQAD